MKTRIADQSCQFGFFEHL